jgi:hypothetical protein
MAKKAASPKALEKKLEKVRFKYIFGEHYNPVYANGCYGGPTTTGEITVHFFTERNPVPHEETFAVTPDGRVADNLGRVPELEHGTATVIRCITAGVIMNAEVARRVYEFLGRNLERVDARIQTRQAVEKTAGKGKRKLNPD